MTRPSLLLTDSILLGGLGQGLGSSMAGHLTRVWTRGEVCIACSEVRRPPMVQAQVLISHIPEGFAEDLVVVNIQRQQRSVFSSLPSGWHE